jgi:murein DD-endopeptidase MepM/ murein hydrolase activator NlpD
MIPDGAKSTRQFSVPQALVHAVIGCAFALAGFMGFFVLDYLELRSVRGSYQKMTAENEGLKGEARILMGNLEEVKRSLRRVQDYATKLGEITSLKVKSVGKKTGIGPLSSEEFDRAKSSDPDMTVQTSGAYVPLGVNMDKLAFRTVFDRLSSIGESANRNAVELQQLLSTMSQHQNILASIPSVTPVNGWITSGFGRRISPFTGEVSMHKGIDVAAPMGTPILSPADGVVVFSGAKEGFGNFIMIAHGYGVVSSYGHNAQNMVQPGQTISRGEQIATVGMSGRTTGPHLHYEVTVNGRIANPKQFILDLEDTSTADSLTAH